MRIEEPTSPVQVDKQIMDRTAMFIYERAPFIRKTIEFYHRSRRVQNLIRPVREEGRWVLPDVDRKRYAIPEEVVVVDGHFGMFWNGIFLSGKRIGIEESKFKFEDPRDCRDVLCVLNEHLVNDLLME